MGWDRTGRHGTRRDNDSESFRCHCSYLGAHETSGAVSTRGPSLMGGNWAVNAATSVATSVTGTPLKSSTTWPFWFRTCTWMLTPLGKRLVIASWYWSASARCSGGTGLLEDGLRLRWMALRICSTLHASNIS
jgi:hypothetical protein